MRYERQVSTTKFTCWVATNGNNVIIDTAPLLKKFKRQPLRNLIKWCVRTQGKVKVSRLYPKPVTIEEI